TTLVEQTNSSTPLALIKGHWKYIQPAPGRSSVIRWGARLLEGAIETGYSSQPQLYNLKKDLGETQNVASKYPKKVKQMAQTLKKIVKTGKSRTKEGINKEN